MAMHNMSSSTRRVGGAHHYPRLLSKIFGKSYPDIHLSRCENTSVLQPFIVSSFHKKWLNLYSNLIEDSTHGLQKEVLELRQRLTLMKRQLANHETLFLNLQSSCTKKENSILILPIQSMS